MTYDANAHTAAGTFIGLDDGGAAFGGTLTLTGTTHTDAGDYPSDAWSFAGGTNYNNASGTVHDFIAKANQTVTWIDPADIVYGTALTGTQLNATVARGVVYCGGSRSQGALTYSSGERHKAGAAGGGQTSARRCGCYATARNLQRCQRRRPHQCCKEKAILTVTTSSKTKSYGSVVTAFTGSVTGQQNGDVITIGSFTSAGAPASALVGSYLITATLSDPGSRLANYTIDNNYGTLTVTLLAGSVYVLNASASGAVSVSGNASLNIPGALIVNSNSASGILASGNALVRSATGIQVVGGIQKSGNRRP